MAASTLLAESESPEAAEGRELARAPARAARDSASLCWEWRGASWERQGELGRGRQIQRGKPLAFRFEPPPR